MSKFEVNKKVYTFCLSVYKLLDTWVLPLMHTLVYVGIGCVIALVGAAVVACIFYLPKVALLLFLLMLVVAVASVLVVKYSSYKS